MFETKGLGAGTSLMGDLLAETAAETKRLELSEGSVVYEPGTPAKNLYYIHAGQVRIYLTGPENSVRLLEILGPRDWFGAEALTDSRVCASRAVAFSKTLASSPPVERALKLLAEHPPAAIELIRQLAIKLQAARADAGGLVFEDCNVRLVKTLLNFSQIAAATSREGDVTLNITHRQLAQAVGAARETVSLGLTHLRQQKILQTGRNRLTFNLEALRAFSRRSMDAPLK